MSLQEYTSRPASCMPTEARWHGAASAESDPCEAPRRRAGTSSPNFHDRSGCRVQDTLYSVPLHGYINSGAQIRNDDLERLGVDVPALFSSGATVLPWLPERLSTAAD